MAAALLCVREAVTLAGVCLCLGPFRQKKTPSLSLFLAASRSLSARILRACTHTLSSAFLVPVIVVFALDSCRSRPRWIFEPEPRCVDDEAPSSASGISNVARVVRCAQPTKSRFTARRVSFWARFAARFTDRPQRVEVAEVVSLRRRSARKPS